MQIDQDDVGIGLMELCHSIAPVDRLRHNFEAFNHIQKFRQASANHGMGFRDQNANRIQWAHLPYLFIPARNALLAHGNAG
jgi:hypothetical protein